MSTAREQILASVRAAVSSRPRTEHPGPFPPGALGAESTARFIGQFRENGGEAVRFESPSEARTWLDELTKDMAGAACERIPPDLAPSIPQLPADTAPLGVSTALAAAAESGTLLLDSGEGRRQQLLPPVHLVWIRERDIETTLGDALARARNAPGRTGLPAAIGLHSGPSKSADIGRVLVVGVHGPGRVIAAILAYE